MIRGSVFSRSIAEIEEEFRQLRKSILEEYDGELLRVKEESAVRSEEMARKEEEVRRTLAESGIEIGKLDGMEDARKLRLDEFLHRVRPRFVDMAPRFDIHLREKTARLAFSSSLGSSQASLLGADLLASDMEFLAKIEGEIGNPSVWLYDANQLKDLMSVAKGSGWGWGAYGHVPYANQAIWWYSWVPPETGTYWIYAGMYYHGFYILYADDNWYTSKNAEVHAFTDIEAHQYYWHGKKEIRIIDRGNDNISESSNLSGSSIWSFNEHFGAGDTVLFKVRFALDTDARGDGSYAELNFSTGKANYIGAPIVIVTKI
ncbi:MAG: hypothetical protein AB1847_04625 [bacterium]